MKSTISFCTVLLIASVSVVTSNALTLSNSNTYKTKVSESRVSKSNSSRANSSKSSESLVSIPSESLLSIPSETYEIIPDNGYADVAINTSKSVKILIITPSEEKIWQKPTPVGNIFYNRIWFTQGIGDYYISVMENLYGKSYSYLKTEKISNNVALDKFLFPAKDIESNAPEIISLSDSITDGLQNDSEKSLKLYEWVSKNIIYDLPKYVKMGNNDYDMNFGALNTLKTKYGVCYDYSTLYAALGRAAGLRVKVISGYLSNGTKKLYHSWNEVYISETQQWIPLDASMGFIYNKLFYNNLDYVNDYQKIDEN